MAGEANILPIAQVRQQVTTLLRERSRLVLAAPTGSGKTTQIPQYIHEDLQLRGRIIVLQPRRLAAVMMARRVAQEMGCPIESGSASSSSSSASRSGQLVGYQTRHDSNIRPENVIRFMTEGLLLRLMQDDPTLRDVGAVILDEFHERNIASDAALAMLKQLQARQRPELKIVVMSATLDVQSVARYLDCPAVEASGRTYDVSIQYIARQTAKTGGGQLGVRAGQPAVWEQASRILAHVLEHEDEGDVLVFMPGVYEINRTIEACMNVARSQVSQGRLRVLPLYSQLSYAQQQLAVSASPAGMRKVVVATNVAETSLTIPGVRHVIDSGLARVSRHDGRRGVNTLWLEPISQASADQRAGRAGRTAPGTCWRLWPEFEHRGRAAMNTPEIRRLDPAQTILWLLSLGVNDPRTFDWLEPPDAQTLAQAMALLKMLGAIDAKQAITPMGRTMAALPVHPRWARVLVAAAERGCLTRMALWCALASQRDIITRDRPSRDRPARGGHSRQQDDASEDDALQSDLQWMEEKFKQAAAANFDASRCQALGVHASAAAEVKQVSQLLVTQARQAGMNMTADSKSRHGDEGDVSDCIACLLEGFADHLAMMRGQGNLCAMIGHSGTVDVGGVDGDVMPAAARRACELSPQTMVSPRNVFLSLDVRETSQAGAVRTLLGVNSLIEPAQLEAWSPSRVVEETTVVWNRQKLAAEEVWQRRFDDLVLEEIIRPTPDPTQAAAMLAQMVTAGELKLEKWDEDVTQWIARVRSVGFWFPEAGLIAYDADDMAVLHQEICHGAVRYNQIKDRPCLEVVRSALDWQQQQFVEKMAPAKLALPGGWRMPITYTDDGSPPRGRGKIQDFYDVESTPVIAGGRVKLLLEILGPNYRPVQMTQDLAGFWQNLYPQLKKELRRRYPRQTWR